MRRLLLVALPVALALAAGSMLLSAWREAGRAAEAAAERARVQREFVERAALARTLPVDPPGPWREESAALLRWYGEQLAGIGNRFPGAEAPARAEPEPKGAKEKALLEDFQKYAAGRAELVRSGRYAPVASALADGLRLDLLAVQPGPSPEGGGPALRIDFALWGAPRLLDRDTSGSRAVTRTVVPVSFRRLAFHFLDEKGAPWGEMSGGGEPYQKLVDPERFVPDLPPGILFGTWWVELFPRPATEVEVELELAARGAAGRERPLRLAVRLPVEEGWRLPPGATYQAEERVVAPPAP
jgi:hypothetical protein